MSAAEEGQRVEAANARFYRVFERMSLPEMDAVWAHGPDVRCIHPGWRRIEGWEAVRASWEAIFANTHEMRFTLTDVQVVPAADLAWVTCTENILSESEGRVGVTSILATNVFERGPGGWRMVHHHASHVLGRAASPAVDE